MIDSWMLQIGTLITSSSYVSFFAAFIWGIMSVIFSPCHLASIPLIIAYIGGITDDKTVKKSFLLSLVFTIGLFITITVLGIVTASAGLLLGNIGKIWNIIIGIIIALIGLYMLGVIKINIPSLNPANQKRKGFIGAFFLGLTYGVVSGGCTFGFIAPMLAMTAVQKTFLHGVILIILFAIGHCIPIIIGGTSTSFANRIVSSSKLQSSGNIIKKIAGIIFVIIGIYIFLK